MGVERGAKGPTSRTGPGRRRGYPWADVLDESHRDEVKHFVTELHLLRGAGPGASGVGSDGEVVDGGAGGGAEYAVGNNGDREHRLMGSGVVCPLYGFGGADDGVDGLVGVGAAEISDAVHGWMHCTVVIRASYCTPYWSKIQ